MNVAVTTLGLVGVGLGAVLLVMGFTCAGTGKHLPRFDTTETFVLGLFCLALSGVFYRSPQFFGHPGAQWWGLRFMVAGAALVAFALCRHLFIRWRKKKQGGRRRPAPKRFLHKRT